MQDDTQKEFVSGPAQREVVDNLCSRLRDATSAFHARIWGEAGIGKTRIAFEATNVPDLAPLVVYCDAASSFRDSDLMNELLRDDNRFSAILLVDECDPDSRSYIWNKFKNLENRITLVTLYGEYDSTSGEILYLEVPPLDSDQIVTVLEGYAFPTDEARRWSEFCGGSPRVAHVIGPNLNSNPDDMLRPPDTVNVWARYIEGSDEANSEAVRQRTLVLRHIALFKRFGYGQPLLGEARAVSRLVEVADPSVTWARFQEIVKDLRSRKILQGETTLYITPRALHVRLWLDWWDTYGESFDYHEFSERLPTQLLEWFMEMFRYASGSQAASNVVKHLLGSNGPFNQEDLLRAQEGAGFFLSLSEADPEATLAYLQTTVGNWGKEKLLAFSEGRREVVWALKNIAVWRNLFPEAAELLLALGEAENEHGISNNASGEFASLFVVGEWRAASTEAPFEERLPILRDAIASTSSERRKLAISACDAALESRYWTRMVGAENQGLRPTANLWAPRTYGELFDAYRQVWKMLLDSLEGLSSEDRGKAVEVLLSRARGLTTVPNLAEMVLTGMRDLIAKSYADQKTVLEHVIQILHYERKELSEEVRLKWQEIHDELTGDDFSSLVKRYAGMDLVEDQFDQEGNQVDQVLPMVEQLAQQAVDDLSLIAKELSWLVTNEAQNGFRFGYEIGRRDNEWVLLPQLLQAQEEAGPQGTRFFFGGYLRAYKERDEEDWETQLDSLAKKIGTQAWVPELTQRSGLLTDKAGNRVLRLAKEGVIPDTQFRLFRFGGVIRSLSPQVFEQWLSHLIPHFPDQPRGCVVIR